MTHASTTSRTTLDADLHLWLVRRAARFIQDIAGERPMNDDRLARRLANTDHRQLARPGFEVPLDECGRAVLVLDLSPRPIEMGDPEQRLAHELGRPCGLRGCSDCRQENNQP